MVYDILHLLLKLVFSYHNYRGNNMDEYSKQRKVRAGHLTDGRHAPCIFPSPLHLPKGEFPATRISG
jgi:hypothetical protein